MDKHKVEQLLHASKEMLNLFVEALVLLQAIHDLETCPVCLRINEHSDWCQLDQFLAKTRETAETLRSYDEQT